MSSRPRPGPRFFPPSTPRPVDGGLKARSTRGAIGTTWWSGRFIEVLEAIGMGSRLQRGRSYARKGQVLSLEVGPGQVAAEVQGSRARPYRVRIGIASFGKAEWAEVERALAENASYVARLLAGQMPEDIEEIFTGVGLSLFPRSARELSLDCTCPDREVPCKHLAAVFYLLAERFDDDPFRILAWRGRDRADLLAHLHATRTGAPSSGEDPGTPLTELLDTFFEPQGPVPARRRSAGGGVLIDQLPPVGVMVRGRPLTEVLHPLYLALRPPSRG